MRQCLCHWDFCFSHCSGVRVFCSKAWISFSSSAKHEFTILITHNTNHTVFILYMHSNDGNKKVQWLVVVKTKEHLSK